MGSYLFRVGATEESLLRVGGRRGVFFVCVWVEVWSGTRAGVLQGVEGRRWRGECGVWRNVWHTTEHTRRGRRLQVSSLRSMGTAAGARASTTGREQDGRGDRAHPGMHGWRALVEGRVVGKGKRGQSAASEGSSRLRFQAAMPDKYLDR